MGDDLVARYVGTGQFYQGIPARDLMVADWAGLDEMQRGIVVASRHYEFVGDGSADTAVDVDELAGMFTVVLSHSLRQAGFDSVEAVREASDEALLAVEGIGPVRLAEIREALGK